MKEKLYKKVYYQSGIFKWCVYESYKKDGWREINCLGTGLTETYLDAAFKSDLIFKENSHKNEYKLRDYAFKVEFVDENEEKQVKEFLRKFDKSYIPINE